MGAPLVIAGMLGAGLQAVGTYGSYQATAANAAYRAQVAANNAATARTNAELERQAGEIGVGNQMLKTRAIVGRTRAAQAASGIDVNKGSFVDARAAEAEAGMVDALTIRSNAAKKAWATETQATGFEGEGKLQSMLADQASDYAPVASVGSLLSNASTVGSNYYRYWQQQP